MMRIFDDEAAIGINTEQGWGQIHKVKYKKRGPKKYQIQIFELENIQIQINLFKYKCNTSIYRLVSAGVYDIPPIA